MNSRNSSFISWDGWEIGGGCFWKEKTRRREKVQKLWNGGARKEKMIYIKKEDGKNQRLHGAGKTGYDSRRICQFPPPRLSWNRYHPWFFFWAGVLTRHCTLYWRKHRCLYSFFYGFLFLCLKSLSNFLLLSANSDSYLTRGFYF